MFRNWARTLGLAILVAAVALGCRSQQPNLKPPPAREVLTSPPSEARFNTSVYPKQAMQQDNNLLKKIREGETSPIMPAKGGGLGPSGMTGSRY